MTPWSKYRCTKLCGDMHPNGLTGGGVRNALTFPAMLSLQRGKVYVRLRVLHRFTSWLTRFYDDNVSGIRTTAIWVRAVIRREFAAGSHGAFDALSSCTPYISRLNFRKCASRYFSGLQKYDFLTFRKRSTSCIVCREQITYRIIANSNKY